MSASANEQRCEPDLTPLLDLVLQMVMFFMLTANFDKFQKNQAVTLPKAAQAVSPDKSVDVRLLVELTNPARNDPDSKLPPGIGKMSLATGTGSEPMASRNALVTRLKIEAEKHKVGRFADPNARRKTKVSVILRADKNVQFRQIYEVMLAIQEAGFEDIQLSAIKG